MGEFEHSVQAPVARERVWAVWTDVTDWPTWNPGVGHAELDGPVVEGATSILEVLAIEPERLFVTESSERFVRLRFEHELTDLKDGELRITHRVRMTGPATPLLRHTVGKRLDARFRRRSRPWSLA